jgi:hypothetical protein
MRCAGIEQLLDFVQGRARAALADQIQTHLASGCARCQDHVDWIREIVHLTASDDSVEPPSWVLNRAIGLFQAPSEQPKPSLLQRLVASLVFDSLTQLQPAGVRQSTSAARQVLYRASDWDVDLSFEAGEKPETIDIAGQMLKGGVSLEQVAGIPVHLAQAGNILFSAQTDQLGEFTFDHVPAGTYELSIELHSQRLWIEHLDVKLAE